MPHPLAIAAAIIAGTLPIVAYAGSIQDREARQQHRIAQGIASGQITATGARTIERREGNIERSRRRDLAALGGHLTSAERANLGRRADRASNAIYRDKHNDIAQPGVTPATSR